MYYNSFNNSMKDRFGCKVYKLALDGGFTCPTRDGTKGCRGCIFCSGKGSGEFAEAPADDIAVQIERAKARVSEKIKAGRYIAYFQNFTNTYAPCEKLRSLFLPAIEHPDIAALDIATRPDCLEPDKVSLLSELNRIKPVWVELGLQTIHPATTDYIRRGYELDVYDDAMQRLKDAGIEVIVHMIIGLPGESDNDMFQTAQYISDSGADGIKLQLLHVIKGTDLCKEYAAGKFETLEKDEYIRILEGCIRRLRPDIVIHRLTGDGDKRSLVAPLWSADKKGVLNAIQAAFVRDDLVQGELI